FARRAYELARWYRQRGAKVVFGGLHVLSCPDEVRPHADALVIGEGVHAWPAVLRDVEAGTLRPVYHGSYRRPYRDDPPPRRALRPLEKIWSAAVSIDVTDDPTLAREMALAGCTGVFIGFESLTNDNITGSNKKSPRTEDYARRVEILHRNGIQVNGSFVLGFDHD